jgi:hypothetical protein
MIKDIALAFLALSIACEKATAPPPPPPDGLSPGTAAWTNQKDGQPSTSVSHSGDVRFQPACPDVIHLGNSPFIIFAIDGGGCFRQGTYSLANTPDVTKNIAAVWSTHIYAFTSPPVPTSGQLTILYASPTRVDGRFEFRGGADSAGTVWTALVQGSFSAIPCPPEGNCGP